MLLFAAEARAADLHPQLASFERQKAERQDLPAESRSDQQSELAAETLLERQIAYSDIKIGRVLQHVFDTADTYCEEVSTGSRAAPISVAPVFSAGLKMLCFYRDDCRSNMEQLRAHRTRLMQGSHAGLTPAETAERSASLQQTRRREAMIQDALRLREVQFLRGIAAVVLEGMADPVYFVTADNLEAHGASGGTVEPIQSNAAPPDEVFSLVSEHYSDGRPNDNRFAKPSYAGKQATLPHEPSPIPPSMLAQALHNCEAIITARTEELHVIRDNYFKSLTRFFFANSSSTQDDFEAQHYP